MLYIVYLFFLSLPFKILAVLKRIGPPKFLKVETFSKIKKNVEGLVEFLIFWRIFKKSDRLVVFEILILVQN